jgi:hypothetical protein
MSRSAPRRRVRACKRLPRCCTTRLEPIAVEAAYAMASAGADAVPLLLNILRGDTEEGTDLETLVRRSKCVP